MAKNLLKILIPALLLVPLAPFSQQAKVWATSEVVQFSDPLLRDRYYQLVQELRCPKCQNQNLADSNAPISKDMKAQIHTMLEAQNTDDQIQSLYSIVLRSILIHGFYGLHPCVLLFLED